MKIYFRFYFVSEHRKVKNENLWTIFCFFFFTQNVNETNTEIKKNNQSRYNRFPRNFFIAVICFFKSASILFESFCCNGSRLYYFRMKSRKTSEKR